MLDTFIQEALPEGDEEYSILSLMGGQTVQRSPEFNKKVAAELASSRSLLSPDKAYFELYEEALPEVEQSEDPKQLFTPLVQAYKQRGTDRISADAVTRLRAGEPMDSVLSHVRTVKTLFDNSNSWNSDVIIRGLQSASSSEMYSAFLSAANAKPYSMLSEQVAKEGRTDFNAEDVQDWASLFLVPDNLINDSNVVQTLNRTGLLKVGDMAELGQAYQRMGPLDREDLWDAVFPALWEEYDGNIPKISAAVSRIQAYDPQFEYNVNATMDALTVVGAALDGKLLAEGAAAVLGVRKLKQLEVKRTANVSKTLRDVGSRSIAADSALQRATDLGDAALAAKNASPYNFENTVLDSSEIVDGLAPEIAARIAEGKESMRTLDDVLAATRKAALNSKATELDTWADDALLGAGGRSAQEIEAEAVQVQALRDETWASMQKSKASTGSNRPTEAYRALEEKLLDYDKQLSRLSKAAEAPEAAKLARQYAGKMRLGHVPEEFADDIAAHEAQVMRDWDNAVAVAKPQKAERVAMEAEVQKMRDELQLDLRSVRELSKEELTSLKLKAARVNSALGKAKAAGDQEKIAQLSEEAAGLRAQFEEHSFALSTKDNLSRLETRDFGPAGRARLKAAVQSARAANKPAAAAKVPDAKPKNAFSEDDAVNAVVQDGVSDVTSAVQKFQTGEAYLDVARAAFASSVSNKERAAFASTKRAVRGIEVVSTSDQNIVLKYTLDDGVETRTYEWNQDALGNWDVSEMTGDLSSLMQSLTTNVLSPAARFNVLAKDLVSNFTLGGMQSAAIYHNLIKLAKSIEKTTNLTKAQALRVEKLLHEGDRLGEVYDAKVMLNTNNVLSTRWEPEEIIAYFKWRQLYDGLADVQNSAVHRLLAFQGYKELHITGLADDVTEVAAKALTDAERARFGTGKYPTDVYVLSDDILEVKALRAEDIGTYEAQGYQLMSIYGDKLATKELQHVLAREGVAVVSKPLRRQVLHKVTGYIPRIYQRGMYFIKDVRTFKTIGAFEGKKEANAWIKSQGKQGTWETFADAELPPEMVQHDNIQGMGGLWYQSRRGEMVTNPQTELPIERMDLGQSTQQYLTTVSELLPLNEYRASVMAQFANAVRAVAQKNGKAQGFLDPTDIVNSEISTGDKAADVVFKGTRQYLQQQLGARTVAESHMSAWMGALVDYMEGGTILGGRARRAAQYLRVQDPVARIKAGVFHAYLGCFNMAQVAVQMNNAVISASVYPEHALGAFYDSLKMRAVLLLDKEAVHVLSTNSKIDLLQAHDELGKLGWWDSVKYGATSQAAAAKRSGYLDSIFRQGDFRTQVSGMGGVTLEATRKALHTGALPFAEGELFARLMAFNIAKREFLKRNPGTKTLDDLSIHSIVQDSLRINMNLQKENAAVWQSNWLTAVPTQFLQVQAKFAENVVGGIYGGARDTLKRVKHTGPRTTGLSGAEATRVAIGQVAVYGMVGVPAGAWMLDWIASSMGYKNEDGTPNTQLFMSENPNTVAMYSEGVLGKWFDMWGANINVNERFSLLAGLDDNVLTAVADAIIQTASGDTSGVRLADLAPAVGVGVRVYNTLDMLTQRVQTMVMYPESTLQELFAGITDVATVASSFNNLEKLHLYRVLGAEYSKSARATIAWKDQEMNFQTQLAKALGFSTDSEFDTWYMAGELKELQNTQNLAAKLVRQAYLAQAEGNQARHDYLLRTAAGVLSNPLEFDDLLSKEFKKMLEGDTMEDANRLKLWKEYVKGNPVQSNLTREMN